ENIRTFAQIIESGKLVAIVSTNSTDYFIYRGEPMGFNYELLKMFCDYMHIKLEIKVNNDIQHSFEYLNSGKCDIVSMNLNYTESRNEQISFTSSISQSRHVLVQRKLDDWKKISKKDQEKHFIRCSDDFNGTKIAVQKKSVFEELLYQFALKFGVQIEVVVNDSLDVEEIIKQVADGEIDYTICDENVAKVNSKYYKNLDVKTALTIPQNFYWAVNSESDSLKNVFDLWVDSIKTTKKFKLLYQKYFENSRSSSMIKSKYHSLNNQIISDYDETIKTYSKEINWDWRLLASLIYQESRFQPNVKSWAGAFGLMQLMPVTARRFGADSLSSPSQNIMAGARYIKYLEKTFFSEIPDKEDRIKFILASYNVGPGHIIDAMELAKKYGKNDKKWDDNVEFYLMHKSNKKYYLDKVVKNGYCRGQDACDFVDEIMERYMNYKNIIKD
ncbi:MAG: transporter substrate-binding domain-containing protein, partial [Bacteroidota bacterium]